MFAVCAVALFCLMSVSHSAPLSCEELVRPLDQKNPYDMVGSWALTAGGLSGAADLEDFKLRDSSWILFANGSEPSQMLFTRHYGFPDRCEVYPSNITGHLGGLTMESLNLTVAFLYTSCPDCVLMRWDVTPGDKLSPALYLVSKRRGLEKKEMDEFRAQVKCLNLLPPVVMDPTKKLCPEGAAGDLTAQTEEG